MAVRQLKDKQSRKLAWKIAEKSRDYFEAGMDEFKKDLFSLQDVFGAYQEDELVGVIVYQIEGAVAEIKWLVVEPDKRGQGVGSELVRRTMEMVDKVKMFKVKTLGESAKDEGYEKTRRFYQKLGFVKLEEIDPYPGWEEGNPCLILVKAGHRGRLPELVVGAYVFNDEGEVLLVRSPKWRKGKMWTVAGGHIEWGETIEEAVVREVKEELGIRVKYEGLLATLEGVFPEDFQDKRHFIYLQCKVRILPGEKIKVDGREIAEAKWWKVEESLRLPEGELHPKTRMVLEMILGETPLK